MVTKTDEQRRRAYELVDFLETHPEQHDQYMWVNKSRGTVDLSTALADCGTTACAAGWTVLLAGERITDYDTVIGFPEGKNYVPYTAADLLGLDTEEMRALFYGAQDLADVRKRIEEIFGPRPDGAI